MGRLAPHRTAAGPWSRRTPSPVGRARAEFTHDLPGRYVVAENDEARILTGELREPDPAAPAGRALPDAAAAAEPGAAQDELPLGDDAIELVRDRASGRRTSRTRPREAHRPTTGHAAGLRHGGRAGRRTRADGRRPGGARGPGDPSEVAVPVETADADWMVAEPAPPRATAAGGGRPSDRRDDRSRLGSEPGDQPLPGTSRQPEARSTDPGRDGVRVRFRV